MKNIIILFLLAGCMFTAKSQPLQVSWLNQIGGPAWDVLSGMAIAPDGKLVVAGSYYESISFNNKTYSSKGSRDCFIAIYNVDGSLVKTVMFGGKGYEYIKKISLTDTEGVLAIIKFERTLTIGDKQIDGPGLNNYLLAYFDKALNLVSQNVISCDQEFDITGLEKSNNDNFAFAGWFSGTLTAEDKTLKALNDVNFFQGKITQNAKISWIKQCETAGSDKAMAMKSDANGGTYITGTTLKGNFEGTGKTKDIPQNMNHLFVATNDPEGKVSSVIYPIYGREIEPVDILKDNDAIWILANFSSSGFVNGVELVSQGMGDIVLLRYDLGTKKTLYYQLGGYGYDMARCIVKSGSQVVVTGWFNYELTIEGQTVKAGQLGPDVFVATFNEDCTPQSLISLKGDKIEFPCNMASSGSGIYIGGEFDGTVSSTTTELKTSGNEDIFIAYIENCNAANPLKIIATEIDPKDKSRGWELNAGTGYESYSWEKDASKTQYYTVTKPGTYTVKVGSYSGCEYTASIEIAGTKSGQLPEEPIVEHSFSLYPTITKGQVYWQPATIWLQQEATVRITDLSGKTVLSTEIKNLNDLFYTIDLTGKSDGTYIVHVSGDNFHESKKIVLKN